MEIRIRFTLQVNALVCLLFLPSFSFFFLCHMYLKVTPRRPSEARSEGSSVGRGKRHAERALSSEPR
jgi:hypothetical protein